MVLPPLRPAVVAVVFVLAVGWSCLAGVAALENGVAVTPPMGWSSWNTLACDYTQSDLQDIAQILIDSGLRDLGYSYFNIDDCWEHSSRDTTGNLQANNTRFPTGMKAWGDWLHSHGFKFGIYTSSGPTTCMGYPGSWGYEEQDAKLFASWGVDFMKLDCCSTNLTMKSVSFPKWSEMLNKTGRPIVYSCDTDELFPPWDDKSIKDKDYEERFWEWAPKYCNMWRTWHDIKPHLWSFTLNLAFQQYSWELVDLSKLAGPGGWNDADMLEVGVPGMKDEWSRSQFSLWSILASPLIMGNDLRKMSQTTLEILSNKEVIAVNQDPLGIQGKRVHSFLAGDVYARKLVDGLAVAFHNARGLLKTKMTVTWEQLGLHAADNVKVRDLWLHKDLGTFTKEFSAVVPRQDIVMIKIFYDWH